MAVRPVLRMGDARLLQRAEPVGDFGSGELRTLLLDMRDTMAALNGAGLAAPQIGVPLRVVIFGVAENPRYPEADAVPETVLINPVIEALDDEMEEAWEGCLSLPGLRGRVPRWRNIRYRGFDENGTPMDRSVSGFHARVVQHECDHLDGILYPMRIRDLRMFGFTEDLFPGREMPAANLKRYAWLSIAVALATILLKGVAWWLTGSVGLLSDALESFVNLAGALMALAMLSLAMTPADESHAHGHGKAEYFSSAFEGFLILVAAVSIGYAAVERLLHPRAIEAVGVGLAVSVLASLINLVTARILMKMGRQHGSITLEADAHHLLTDVWTSAGVIIGVGVVWLTGWLWLDPAIALLVAANIVWTGWQLLRRSASGLMDESIPQQQIEAIEAVLAGYRLQGLDFHALRTRQAGMRAFVTLHVMVPGAWTVQQGHDWLEKIEADIRSAVPNANVTTHLEPLEDAVSLSDATLDRLS